MFGVLVTWLAGVGRYWDHSDALGFQYLGLGSVIYIIVLGAVLWGFGKPLRLSNWTYQNLLIFLGFCSLPALLYAIPVERMTTLEGARELNVMFLSVVAVWRVALLFHFLMRVASLGVGGAFVLLLLPMALIISALAILNLEHATFEVMAGLERESGTSNDGLYFVVAVLASLSVLASPGLILAYILLVALRRGWIGKQLT